ncbi:MAG TPA: hypothetical protein VF459_02600 [Caulobacteraceae bacterium]
MKRILPFLVLGPFTGPLAAGLVHTARNGRYWMASVYALGIVEVWAGLPTILTQELAFLAHRLA